MHATPPPSAPATVPPVVSVYIEAGKRRCFAGAVEWPGWCRSGRDEESAVEALLAYLPRYRRVVGASGRGIGTPRSLSDLTVVERLTGDSGTEFGTPGTAPSADDRAIDGSELRRQLRILEACWSVFDDAALAARGRQLTVGPRGGGRPLEKIVAHVDEAELAYLRRLGGQVSKGADGTTLRAAFIQAVKDRAAGLTPDTGPRGGRRWSARYGIRRAAWHLLDHAWEIEDRVT